MTRRRLGKFVLEERLGKGGMAEVWRARAGDGGGAVVVKRMHAYLAEDTQFRRMFAAEARVAARLQHANIARLVEVGDAGDELFLVMEHVAGIDLATLLRAQARPLPVGAALHIARDVARALAHAHALAVIHRDVTPSNVMVGFDGVVRLIDFGIAKAIDELADPKTKTGVLKGKVGYMAPEQLRAGETIDARVDVYAVGVVLHEMLCGRRLFKADSEARAIDLVLAGNVRAPSTVNASVPPELDAICGRALALERDARWAGAAELAGALDEALARSGWDVTATGELARASAPPPSSDEITREEPASERAPATVTQAASSPRRRRMWMLALAAIGIAAAAAVALSRARSPRAQSAIPIAAPSAAPPAIAAPPANVAPPAIAAPPPVAATAPPASRIKPQRPRRHAADIERGDVVDPFHRK